MAKKNTKLMERIRTSIRVMKAALWLFCKLGYRNVTLKKRVLPTLFVLGPPRSGTSSLEYYLAQHPCYVPALLKELQYDPDARPLGELYLKLYQHVPTLAQGPLIGAVQALYYRGGTKGYRKLFPLKSRMEKTARDFGNAITADHTVEGLYSSTTIDGFPYCLGNDRAKFVTILRNPVDFLFSVYTYQISHNFPNVNRDLSFDRFVRFPEEHYRHPGFIKRAKANMQQWHRLFKQRSFFDESRFSITTFMVSYVVFVKHWASRLPKDRFLVLSFTDLAEHSGDTIKTVFSFLELPNLEVLDSRVINANVYADKTIPPETAAYIRDVCKPYNDELYEFLGRDLGWN